MNLSMIGSYLKAKWSKGIGNKRADVSTKDIRLLSCFGDGKDIPVCPGLMPSQEQAGKFYCGECGCGDRRATWLNTDEREYGKLDHPYLSCPRKMPGFSDYEEWVEGGEQRKRNIELTLSIKDIDSNTIKPVHPNMKDDTDDAPQSTEEVNSHLPKKGCRACEAKQKFRETNLDIINYYNSQGEKIPDDVLKRLQIRKNEIFAMVAEEEQQQKPTASPIEEKPKCAACEKRRQELIKARKAKKSD